MEGIHGHGALDVCRTYAPVGEVEGEIDGLGLGKLLDGPKCTVDLGPLVFSFSLARPFPIYLIFQIVLVL